MGYRTILAVVIAVGGLDLRPHVHIDIAAQQLRVSLVDQVDIAVSSLLLSSKLIAKVLCRLNPVTMCGIS